jgi:hypothetical protein
MSQDSPSKSPSKSSPQKPAKKVTEAPLTGPPAKVTLDSANPKNDEGASR